MTNSDLRFHIEKVDDIDRHEQTWRALESESDASIFLSWEWISCWAKVMTPELQLCTVFNQNKIVAMGFLAINDVKRHAILPVRQLRLHTTGIQDKDQIWPEYNGLLIAKGFEQAVYEGFVQFLEGVDDSWDELLLGPIASDVLNTINYSSTTPVQIWNAPSYTVALQSLRDQQVDYIESLSKNTRQQIRRSMNHYQREGELILHKAETIEEALQYFQSTGPIHQQRWGKDSGFNNRYFVEFHQRLIQCGFDSGSDSGIVELYKLSVGGETLGYLYNFVYQNKVYFYLSGISPSTENKLKPGLVFHALCIKQYMENGKDSYDFLGGEAQYKQSLGDKNDGLVLCALQRPVLKLRIEQHARGIKHFFQRYQSIIRTS